jgi:hypothetical protein
MDRRSGGFGSAGGSPDADADGSRPRADAGRRAVRRETGEKLPPPHFSGSKSPALAQSDLRRLIEWSRLEGARRSAVYLLDWDALGTGDRDFAMRLLNDPNWAVRNITILGLAARSISCRLPLIDRLEHEQHPTNVDILLARPCDLADPAAAPVLLKFARADDGFHRLKALEGLLKVGDGGRKHFCGSR